MNATNLPGYTAKASLYKTNQRYQVKASGAGVIGVYVGPAQFIGRQPGNGQENGPSCTPKNLGCLKDPASPTGCFNYFLTADCETLQLAPCQCPPPPGGGGPVYYACESTSKTCSCTGGGDCINMDRAKVCADNPTCGPISCTCKWKQ